jgi:hypothetical protein
VRFLQRVSNLHINQKITLTIILIIAKRMVGFLMKMENSNIRCRIQYLIHIRYPKWLMAGPPMAPIERFFFIIINCERIFFIIKQILLIRLQWGICLSFVPKMI